MNQETQLLSILLQVNALRKQGSYQQAITLLLSQHPSLTRHRVLAHCYYDWAEQTPDNPEQLYVKAAACFQEALLIAPDNGRVHAYLAELYAQGLCRYQDAATEYREALKYIPHDAWVLISAAALYGLPEAVVSLSEATTWLERAIIVEPNAPHILARLGEFYYQAGRIPEALCMWERAASCTLPLQEGYAQMITELIERV